MIVKLKCVSNVDQYNCESAYITVNKTYRGRMLGDSFITKDDNGRELILHPSNDIHGKWEVVTE